MDNNPLRQYFRRPAVYLKLPSGGKDYQPGMIDMPEMGELPVYPMTAIDEITARTPDALYNGTALTELIKSCIPSIKDPWSISSNDLDSILIAIKAASGNEILEIDSECTSCSEINSYGINLMGILSTFTLGDYDTPLTIGELKFKLRPLNYREMNEAALGQFELQKVFYQVDSAETDEEKTAITRSALEKLTLLTMKIIGKAIEYIETPANDLGQSTRVEDPDFILDFLKSCDRNVYIGVRDHNTKLKSSAEIKPLQMKCAGCGHEYEQVFTLSPVDFFE
jgi:hypothetical protein